MISTKDLRIELELLNETRSKIADPYQRAMLKSNELIIKLLANMRTNQALALQGSGIDLVPRRINNEDQENQG